MEALSVRKNNLLFGFDNIPGEKFGKHWSYYASYTNVKRLRENQGNVEKEEVPAILGNKVLCIQVVEV